MTRELLDRGSEGVLSRGLALVVDQDRNDLHVYGEVLRQLGFDVREFAAYRRALQSLDEEIPDFVLVSQGSQAFEGRLIVSLVMEKNRRIPVVVTAKCLNIGCYLEAMQLGAVDYVEKPLAPVEIEYLVTTYWEPKGESVSESRWKPMQTPLAESVHASSYSDRKH